MQDREGGTRVTEEDEEEEEEKEEEEEGEEEEEEEEESGLSHSGGFGVWAMVNFL
jgi:hypothetical protein